MDVCEGVVPMPVLQVAMATAQVLFHRFYYAKSFTKYNVQVRVGLFR